MKENVGLKDILAYLRGSNKGQKTFYGQLCWLAPVIPFTNAASERSFSVMKRLKTYLRSTMTESRLNHLMISSIYKEMLDGIDTTVAAREEVNTDFGYLGLFNFYYS